MADWIGLPNAISFIEFTSKYWLLSSNLVLFSSSMKSCLKEKTKQYPKNKVTKMIPSSVWRNRFLSFSAYLDLQLYFFAFVLFSKHITQCSLSKVCLWGETQSVKCVVPSTKRMTPLFQSFSDSFNVNIEICPQLSVLSLFL